MEDAEHFDAVVIGSGQGGGPLATAFAASGRKSALIERVHIGGTCINEGCTPTKTMIASGRVAYLAGRARDYGMEIGPVHIDMPAVVRRKAEIVEEFRTSSTRSLREGGVEIINGEACFTGPRTLEVQGGGRQRALAADVIVIDTGGRPALPPVPGLAEIVPLTSTTIMELDDLPEHLLVLGGGYIGLEFGQLFRRLGSRVTVIEAGPRLMAREDDDIADAMAHILRQDGIEILFQTKVQRVWREGDVRVLATTPEGERELRGSHLLVAAGRAPNTERLNVKAAGVELDGHGFIQVNERLETTAPGIYALGDVAGSPQFTHISYDDFRILRANIIDGGNRSRRDRLVPYTMFTDPQLGRVGMSEREARQAGKKIKVAKIPMNYVARAIEVDEARGLIKAVVDADSGEILGCAVLGLDGGEVMAMIEIAMMGKLPYTALRDGVFAHPTLAESLNTLFSSVEG